MSKKDRHIAIEEIVSTQEVESQEMLLNLLLDRGFELTQATLSRDVKELKIVKMPTALGKYVYQSTGNQQTEPSQLSSHGFLGIEFSGNLAVVKTRPGYAMGIAAEIDEKISREIIGTVAGDDTILLIIRENVGQEEVRRALAQFIKHQ
ncbi:arginine repressor [Viscerimonas tarda]